MGLLLSSRPNSPHRMSEKSHEEVPPPPKAAVAIQNALVDGRDLELRLSWYSRAAYGGQTWFATSQAKAESASAPRKSGSKPQGGYTGSAKMRSVMAPLYDARFSQ